jgi:hypothetical protein
LKKCFSYRAALRSRRSQSGKMKGPPDGLGGPVTDTCGIVIPTSKNGHLSILTGLPIRDCAKRLPTLRTLQALAIQTQYLSSGVVLGAMRTRPGRDWWELRVTGASPRSTSVSLESLVGFLGIIDDNYCVAVKAHEPAFSAHRAQNREVRRRCHAARLWFASQGCCK